MAYLHCPRCRLVTFRAGGDSSPEACPRCDAQLRTRPRALFRRDARATQPTAASPRARTVVKGAA